MPRERRLALGALQLLKNLGTQGAANHPVKLSSREAAKLVGVSQQMADNYLVDLEERGLVRRALTARTQHLTLTKEGLELLRRDYIELKQIFQAGGSIQLGGQVVSGLGEGRYYLGKEGYVRQFQRILGYTPFPGTLNVKLSREMRHLADEVRTLGGLRIEGFQDEGRTFGGATCYPARIQGKECHLIIPDRTHYEDVLEFISPKNLRKALDLQDGTEVEMEVTR